MEGKFSKKVKILFTIPNFDTAGSGKALFKIASGLDKEKFSPSILCVRDDGAFFETVKNSGIPVHFFEYRTNVKNKFTGLKHCYEVSKYIKSLRKHIIHSFNYSDDYSEGLSAKIAGVKWVYSKKNMMWNSNAWTLRTFFADGIIALNTDMMKLFFENKKKVKLIPRGVDLNEFHFREKPDYLLKEYGLNYNDRILLCIANFAPVKGIDILLVAFEKLTRIYDDVKLVIVGDYKNTYGEEILSKFNDIIKNKKLILTGKKVDTSHFYNLADFFILPTGTRGEGTSVAVLEAMASDCPVLASDVSGNRDQLELLPGQLFESNNSDSLAARLNEYLSKPKSEIAEIKKIQKEIVSKYYSLNTEIEKHEKFYLKILNRN